MILFVMMTIMGDAVEVDSLISELLKVKPQLRLTSKKVFWADRLEEDKKHAA